MATWNRRKERRRAGRRRRRAGGDELRGEKKINKRGRAEDKKSK